MLKISQPDDARVAVGAAAVVPRRTAVDSQRLDAAAGQMVEGGAAHAAGPQDDALIALSIDAAPRRALPGRGVFTGPIAKLHHGGELSTGRMPPSRGRKGPIPERRRLAP